ncbi:MAG TPA: 2-hydroxy-3-oxopropionate reductase [Syntrophorhabdaceae bacterium]|nr:2-hydroxy-3-oxopropionate reductase [Syntrophorhabdaceae bacterium]
MANIGFIGLGIMGRPMAGHILNAGHNLYIYDKVEACMSELINKGCKACKSSKEVAENSEIVFLMLPDTPDVEEALFGKDGIVYGIKKGGIVVDMSSISPTATKRFAEKLREYGVEMLDAPVSGGQIGAENATLSIMVGGKTEIFEKIKPYFELMGKNIVLIGGNGDGQVCKVANQMVVAMTIEAISEAFVFASKAGADVKKVREALLGGFAGSKILEIHGERIIKRNFQPGFRIKLHQKDLNLALQAARELGLSLPNTSLALQLFNAVAADGGMDLDHSAMVKALEKLANHTVK